MPKLRNAKIEPYPNRNGELHLEVTDNGIGINQWQIDDPRSFGMIGMRERAHLWGGTVHISGTSNPPEPK